MAVNGPVLVPLEKTNNGWETRRKTWKDAVGHKSLWEICKSHRKHVKHSSNRPPIAMKEFGCFFKYVWETPNKLPSALSISLTLHAYGHIFFRTAFYSCGGFLWGTCPVQQSFPFLLLYCFSLEAEKKLHCTHRQLWSRWLHQLPENTKRSTFQASRQKYPHLLPISMAIEVKGGCLLLSMAAASDDDELQISLCKAERLIRWDREQPGFF